MSREEWEAIQEGKIPKHYHSVDFEFNFEVTSYADNRKSILPLKIFSHGKTNELISHDVILDNMTVIEFSGKTDKSTVAVSNELINNYLGAKQKSSRYYWYFFLKENVVCTQLAHNIWISETQLEKLGFDPVCIEKQENLKIRKMKVLR